MTERPDLAPLIAKFLAERVLTLDVSKLARLEAGLAEEAWQKMFEAYPQANEDEVRRGTLIAIELMMLRSEEIGMEAERLRKHLED